MRGIPALVGLRQPEDSVTTSGSGAVVDDLVVGYLARPWLDGRDVVEHAARLLGDLPKDYW